MGNDDSGPLLEVMAQSELFESKGAIRRLVQQGGVKIDAEKQSDPNKAISRPDNELTFQAGKRIFFKVLG